MSHINKENIVCPNCKESSKFNMYNFANIINNPELKERILNKDIFKFICPNCNKEYIVNYNMIYCDTNSKLTIHFVCDKNSLKKTIDLIKEQDTLFNLDKELNQKYINRIVITADDLIEKIKINDSGLNDKLVEIIKALYIKTIKKSNQDINIDIIYFDGMRKDNRGILKFITDDNKEFEDSFTMEFYNEVKVKFSRLLEKNDEIVVNEAYANTVIREQQKRKSK